MSEHLPSLERHLVSLDRVIAARFEASVPPSLWDDRRGDRNVEGWLVGAVGKGDTGWWGPVDEPTARNAMRLFSALEERAQASPAEWARRLRRALRHAHTGVLAVSVGCVELACWDLLGRREKRPVWALLREEAHQPSVRAYATCFGADVLGEGAERVAAGVGAVWPVQKWKAPRLVEETLAETARAIEPLTRHGIALDFQGRARPELVKALCRALDGALEWVEEPCAPEDLHRCVRGEFGVPHAAGEHSYGPADATVLTASGVDIWQPDAVFCGGFSSLAELATSCESAGARFVPHGGGFLPALHLAAAGWNVECVEYHLALEPRRQAQWAAPVLACDGASLRIPTAPGWAGGLDPEVLA